MQFATATTVLSYRERAIQAAVTAKLTSFAAAYESNPAHAAKVASSLSKTSSALARFATLCDTNVIKQLAFVQPNFRMATLSCPFPGIVSIDELEKSGRNVLKPMKLISYETD